MILVGVGILVGRNQPTSFMLEKLQAQEDVEPTENIGTYAYQPVTRILGWFQRLSSTYKHTQKLKNHQNISSMNCNASSIIRQ
jgi:hypothetical protein